MAGRASARPPVDNRRSLPDDELLMMPWTLLSRPAPRGGALLFIIALSGLVGGCEGPLDWVTDRVFATHTNTAVFRCVTRNLDAGLGEYVHRLCRVQHSIPVDGANMGVSITCDEAGRVIATVQNNSREIIVTGFRIVADGGEGRSIEGDWLTPTSFARYPVAGRCNTDTMPQVEVVAFRGVRARLRPVIAAGLGADPTPVFPTATLPGTPEQAGQGSEPSVAVATAQPIQTSVPEASPASDDDEDPIPAPVLAEQRVAEPAPANQTTPEPDTGADTRPSVQVSREDVQVLESGGAAYVPMRFTRPLPAAAWVNYRLLPRSAQRDNDFAGALYERVQIPAGSRSAAILIPIVNDSEAEPEETFSVLLDFSSSNILFPEPVEILVRISDDD